MKMWCLSRNDSQDGKIMEIGAPTDFRVVQHVGLSNDGKGFEVTFTI